MPHDIAAIPAFNDNYIWLIIHPESSQAVVVDPGTADPVISTLEQMNLTLAAILITHHHADHTGGVKNLLKYKKVPVYGPEKDNISPCDHFLNEGDEVKLPEVELEFKVLEVPGHTLGHIAYLGHGWLFCGDTLFAGGCGRLFEGTPSQLYHSLKRLGELDPSTHVYCAHEYTVDNLKFALSVEPYNTEVAERLGSAELQRSKGIPTLPSTIAIERETNPFLRCETDSIQQAIEDHYGHNVADTVAVFAGLRRWKDEW